MIPGYLTSNDLEFFSDGANDAFISNGKTFDFDSAPEEILQRVEDFINRNEEIAHGLTLMGIKGRRERIRKVCKCLFSQFDLVSDFAEKRHNTEYSHCPFRSRCPAVDFICKSRNLSPREIQIASLLADDMSEKEIANAMKLSKTTIHTHFRNIRKAINAQSKAGVIAYLIRNNLA